MVVARSSQGTYCPALLFPQSVLVWEERQSFDLPGTVHFDLIVHLNGEAMLSIMGLWFPQTVTVPSVENRLLRHGAWVEFPSLPGPQFPSLC